MPELPILPDKGYPAVEGISAQDLSGCCARFDACLDYGESASDVGEARASLEAPGREVPGRRVPGRRVPGKEGLLQVHRLLFAGRTEAGRLRESEVAGVFPGQDCPGPQFLERSLDNFEQWLAADSFNEIHPIEQTALTLTRLVDIWPFEFGNRTAATVFSSLFLTRAGYPPFLVLPDQVGDFDESLARAIRMETAPLVKTISECIERELVRVRK